MAAMAGTGSLADTATTTFGAGRPKYVVVLQDHELDAKRADRPEVSERER
jgi:hypothetical protein